jgi:Rrf2 family protein
MTITKTSLSAIRALLFLARNPPGAVFSPRRIAEELGESPTYMAKVSRLLVKVGILRAEKGVKGGVRLDRRPADISLLSVVEACQGSIVGNYCRVECDPGLTCAFHQAALELQAAVVRVLSRWSLAQLVEKPAPAARRRGGPIPCVMLGGAIAGLTQIALQGD